jgi:hypothetical protein
LIRFKQFTHCALAAVLALGALAIGGCSKDETIIVPDESFVVALLIIPSPLCPKPGELTQLTVQALGEGSWADYYWSVEAGSLLTDEGISVPWRAPSETGEVSVRVIATLGASADTVQKTIMVSNYDRLDTGVEISLEPVIYGDQLYFTGVDVDLTSEDFYGFDIYSYESGSSNLRSGCAFACSGGETFMYRPSVGSGSVLGSVTNYTNLSLRLFPANIFIWDMMGVAPPIAITNEVVTQSGRANRNYNPDGSDDLNMIVWQHQEVGELPDGSWDLFNLEFYNRLLDERLTLTSSLDSATVIYGADTVTEYTYYYNIKPLFTPQEDYIVYFVDTTGFFEPCMISIDAGIPDTTTRVALMVEDEDYGIFEEAGIEIGESTIFEWCPSSDILAFIDDDGYVCFFYPYSESVDRLTSIGVASEFTWAPDGEQFAVVTDEGLAIGMTLSGAVDLVYARAKVTDEIIGIAWSPSDTDPKIGFRHVRMGKTSVDSYSSLIIYSVNDDDWYYALERVPWTGELEVGYTLKRIFFEADNEGVYLSVPTEDRSVLYHSYR